MALVYRGLSGSQPVYWLEGSATPAGVTNVVLASEANTISGSAGSTTVSRFGSSMPSYHGINRITREIIGHYSGENPVGGIFYMTASGTGSSVISDYVPTTGFPGTSYNFSTGTTATGWACMSTHIGASGLGSIILRDGYTVRLRTFVRLDWFATVAQNYQFYSGFINSGFPVSVGVAGSGCYFFYNYATNAGRWTCVANGSQFDSGVTMNELQSYVLEIEVTNSGSVRFWIDGVLVASTTISVTGTVLKIIPGTISKTAGTTSRNFFIFNPIFLDYEFSSAI